jgi:peptidylprolyl isomerase
MKTPLLICVLCLALVAGVSGCGGDDTTSARTQDTGSASTADDSATTTDSGGEAKPENADEGDSKPEDESSETPAGNPVLADYEAEGPFAAVSGGKGNQKPTFEPSGEPAPKEVVTRELEVGSGPAAKRGDEVSVYFAGAIFETGEVELYGWPPSGPSVFELGAGLYGEDWEKTIEGMKAGGIRQVILPESEFAAGKPVDYVIVLTDLQPKSK